MGESEAQMWREIAEWTSGRKDRYVVMHPRISVPLIRRYCEHATVPSKAGLGKEPFTKVSRSLLCLFLALESEDEP